jgi:hypothetical protein
MDAARKGAQPDLLTRTTLRLGRGPATSIAQVVYALQRVPGVLTVQADDVNAQALVAHDAAVPLASLVAAVTSAGGAATVVTDSRAGAAAAATMPLFVGKRRQIKSAAVVAMLAVIVIGMALPNSPEKRWLFIVPLVLLWAFVIFEGLVTRHRSDRSESKLG